MSPVNRTCTKCGGTGQLGSVYYPRECDRCNGTGQIGVSSRSVTCPICKSSGVKYSPMRGDEPCPKCGGSGYVEPPRR